jgi:polyisoprenyl-phosphate glycosyltransferase
MQVVFGIFSFSYYPLQFVLKLGMLISGFSLAGFVTLALLELGNKHISGLMWLGFLILFTGGLQLIGMGFVGEYVGRIYEETKSRPLYIINALHGIEPEK